MRTNELSYGVRMLVRILARASKSGGTPTLLKLGIGTRLFY